MTRTQTLHPLCAWRKSNGMSQTVLAAQLDCTQAHLSEIENGNNRPSLKLALKLHELTGIDVKTLAGPQ